MDFITLSLIFASTGILAIGYYRWVPTADRLRQRLPNRVSWAGVIATLVIGVVLWQIIRSSDGFRTVVYVFTLLLGLLVFESVFLLLIRWLRSNLLAVLISLASAGAMIYLYLGNPTFLWRNVVIIAATLGATTLLVRLAYLRTRFLWLVAGLWTIYDVLVSWFIFPRVFVPVAAPRADLFFPSVVIGTTSLGSGDFIFLVLFTLVLLRDFGVGAALVLLGIETLGLLITGIIISGEEFIIPFLIVMTPIFFITYGAFRWWRRRQNTTIQSHA